MTVRSAFARRMGLSRDPIFLMDGSAFMFRGFYANQSMQRSDGFPTNALFMMARVVLRVLREERPEHFCVILDGKGPNFRHELFPAYKANRSATPEPLVQQIKPIHEMLRVLGVPLEISSACEADDCIASLTARYRDEYPIVIVGTDKDLRQCLAPNVILWDPAAKDERIVTLDSFRAEAGVEPQYWPDVQAVIGDSADNIPGVPGVGPKTAKTLFEQFSSLEDIRDRFAEMPEKLQKKFADHLDTMFLYRQLTTLRTSECGGLSLDDLTVKPLNPQRALGMLQEYELRSLVRDVQAMLRDGTLKAVAEDTAPETMELPWDEEPAPASGARAKAPGTQQHVQASLFDPAPAAKAQGQGGAAGGSFRSQFSQTSLYADEAAPAVLAGTTGDIAQLPACDGVPVAIIPPWDIDAPEDADAPESGWHVGIDGEEWVYTGPVGQLVAWLAPAAQIIVPDLKALLRPPTAAGTSPDASLNNSTVWSALSAPRTPSGAPYSRCFDLGLAAYLMNPEERDYSWKHLCMRFSDELGLSARNPACLALEATAVLTGKMNAAQLSQLLRTLEQPLVPVLADMEAAGITLDKQAFADFLTEVQASLDRLTAEIYAAAGGEFNIRSSQQLGDLLFNKLGLPSARKTGGGQLSTSQEVLEKLSGKHPVVDAVLEFRKLEKLRSTYLEPLPPLADAAGRIHTTFNQKATATGRLSSSEPNLQNIPVRGDQGQRMRACFTAGPGLALVSADYSQVELRVLAHMSQDPTLLAAFHENADIHSRTAALIFNVPQAEVSPTQRRNAKTINFGLVYGMGPQKLAQELGITMNQAKEFIENYFSHMQKLREFYDQTEESAKEHGFVTTLAGRRRLLPDIHSANKQLQSTARRQAINTLIQGSAADIIKLAMLAAHADQRLQALNARLILQIHDELLLEAPPQNAQEAGQVLAEIMSSVAPGGQRLSVPLMVDWGAGTSWEDAH